jgi:hypothetical protein
MEELLEAMFSMRSVPGCKQDKSRVQLVGRGSPSSKGVNTEVEETNALKAATRQRLKKTQQTEKT